MTGDIKTAFDGIRAEDSLKANTLLYLRGEIQKRGTTHVRNPVRSFAVALASVIVVALSSVFSYNLYFTPSAYVDVDVNPSVGITLNRFDRVINTHAYNADGEAVLAALPLKYKNYEDALILLIDAIDQSGYIQNDGLVSVTVQTNNRENELLSNIQTGVESYIVGHHQGTQIDVFSVNSDTRSQAYKFNISPTKYLAIQELIEIDQTASVESCRDHSISDIKQFTQEHTGNHHGNSSSGSNNEHLIESENPKDDEHDEPKDTQPPVGDSDNHGENNDNGHHGDGHE